MATPTPELIAGMTFLELHQLAQLVAERMHELRESGLEKLHAELEEKASNLGYSLTELMAIAKKKRRRGRPRKDNGEAAYAE